MEQSLRWRIGVGAAAVLVGGAVVGAVVTQATVPQIAPAVVEGEAEGEASSTILVDVQGAVARPGVYTLADGARVVDAIARAGGTSGDADSSSLNLAQPLADGAQVRVPAAGEQPAAATDEAGLVSINTATAEELDTLPRIGPSLAAAIIAHRDEHGPFASVEALDDVSGIGPAMLAQLEPLVTL